MSRRTERLSGLFQSELAELIRSEMRDPRIAEVVSITRVDVSPDLEKAHVYVSVLAERAEQAASVDALNHAAPFLRRHLIDRIHIRKVPALHFEPDHSIEEGQRMLELMKRVAEEREGQPPPDA